MEKKKKVSQEDIRAFFPELSPSAISRILADEPNCKVSSEVRAAVKAKAKELGYNRKYTKRKKVSKKENSKLHVGIMQCFDVTAKDKLFYCTIQSGLTKLLQTTGSKIYLLPYSKEMHFSFLAKEIKEFDINLLYVLGEPVDQKFIKDLNDSLKIDIIALCWKPTLEKLNIFSCDTENFTAAYKLTEYLINKGHKKIAFVDSAARTAHSKERYYGYVCCLMEYGLDICEEYNISIEEVKNPSFADVSIFKKTYDEIFFNYDDYKERLNKKEVSLPTAYVCSSDFQALCLLKEFKRLGISVPDEVSIVGYGNFLYYIDNVLSLTSFDVSTDGFLNNAAELGQRIYKDKKNKRFSLITNGQIIEGNSVAELLC